MLESSVIRHNNFLLANSGGCTLLDFLSLAYAGAGYAYNEMDRGCLSFLDQRRDVWKELMNEHTTDSGA